MKKKLAVLLLLALLLPTVAACSESTENAETAPASTPVTPQPSAEPETETETVEEVSAPELPTFSGASFTFGVVDNPNAKNAIVMEEINGEVLNDAQFEAIGLAEQALNVEIGEYVMTNSYPAANAITPIIASGDDVIQVANVYCVDATTLLSNRYVYDYSAIPYLDLDKPWWDQSVNESLTLGGIRYAAIGDLSISTHDLTYVLLYSTALAVQHGLENPYSLVFEGNWTMDKMKSMSEAVLLDVNGNGERDKEDVYGYLANGKMVLPSFWIGAGVKSMEVDDAGVPTLTVTDEKFIDVFNKIFAMTYDNNAWIKVKEDYDVPTENLTMFSANQSLFLDCSLFHVAALREMESDFGIIPYPKYDDAQSTYCARVSYYMPPMIPVTNGDLALVGAVLEETNYQAMMKIKPAYYEITLKGKYARDLESLAMLDLIMSSRVVDLGDTLFCANVRDGFMSSLFNSDNRDLVSTAAKNVKVINKTIEKMIASITEGD